jgi:hypothetical protein
VPAYISGRRASGRLALGGNCGSLDIGVISISLGALALRTRIVGGRFRCALRCGCGTRPARTRADIHRAPHRARPRIYHAKKGFAYKFAHGCIKEGSESAISAAAAAVICFEWLQRPENVIAGHIKWSGYRVPGKLPTIQIEHHKTGAKIDHPLEESLDDGTIVQFYPEAEEVLSHLKRLGTPMILREITTGKGDDARSVGKPFAFSGMQKIVQRMRTFCELPAEFTLDACRHGGMTELEEAELTEGQGRALSAHRTRESYAGYAKRTAPRILSATKKRHAHVMATKATTAADSPTEAAEKPILPRKRTA